jgi:multiple sugar transport system permease protein
MIVVLLLMVAYPFFSNIGYSFFDYKLTKIDKTFIGFKNYIKIFSTENFFDLLKNTLVWSGGNMISIFFLGLSVGLLLDSRIRGKVILQTVLLIPWVIPEVVTAYTWKWMMASDYGILNRILLNLHLIGPQFCWVRDGEMAMLAVFMTNVWRSFPFLAVMVYAKKRSMPKDGVEAAVIDGASSLQIFRYITWPYIKPVVSRVTLLIFIWSYNAFAIVFTMTDGGPLGATTTFPIYIQKKAFQNYDFGLTAAMSVIMMISMLIILFLLKSLPKIWNELINSPILKKVYHEKSAISVN